MRISDWSSDVCSSDLNSCPAGKYRSGHVLASDWRNRKPISHYSPERDAAPPRCTRAAPGFASVSRRLFIEGDDASAAQADIVLKGEADIVDLPTFGGAPQLVAQLITLGKARRTERMSLRPKAARGIGPELATHREKCGE